MSAFFTAKRKPYNQSEHYRYDPPRTSMSDCVVLNWLSLEAIESVSLQEQPPEIVVGVPLLNMRLSGGRPTGASGARGAPWADANSSEPLYPDEWRP